MNRIGFSTGAIAFGDFHRALSLLAKLDVDAVELSALRLAELSPLVRELDHLQLDHFRYISFHAPSRFSSSEEAAVVDQLTPIVERGWPIVLHPDSLHDVQRWVPIQEHLCFENMDKRKPIGRTADELLSFLRPFPKSSVCFDIGHAHQVDRTMTAARTIAQRFAGRIRQVHVSEVNTASQHVAISAVSDLAFHKILDMIVPLTPLIIESVLSEHELQRELDRVRALFRECDHAFAETD